MSQLIAYRNKGGMFAGLSFMVLIFVASFVEMQNWIRVLLIAFGLVTFVVGLHNSLRIEQTAEYYEYGIQVCLMKNVLTAVWVEE